MLHKYRLPDGTRTVPDPTPTTPSLLDCDRDLFLRLTLAGDVTRPRHNVTFLWSTVHCIPQVPSEDTSEDTS